MLDKVRRWARNPVTTEAVANLLVIVLGTFLVAVTGLVVEDWLAKPVADAHVVRSRWVAVIVSVVALFLGLLWRRRSRWRTGTLFHVQILDEAFDDLRREGALEAKAQKLNGRSVTRWVDLHHRAQASGVIDLVDVCAEVGTALEEQINDDDPDTGHTVAPNMPWPAAFAIGGSLPPLEDMRLLELPTQTTPRIEVALIEPSLDQAFDGAGDAVSKIKALPALGLQVDRFGDVERSPRIGVWLAFTAAARHYSWATLMPDFGVDAGYVMHTGTSSLGADEKPELRTLADHEVAALGQTIAALLVDLKKPDQELVVVGMITKVAALSAGWHIAQQPCRFFAGTYLLHYDLDTRDFISMRVRESQPNGVPHRA